MARFILPAGRDSSGPETRMWTLAVSVFELARFAGDRPLREASTGTNGLKLGSRASRRRCRLAPSTPVSVRVVLAA